MDEETKKKLIKLGIWAAVGIAGFFAVRALLRRFGLVQSRAERLASGGTYDQAQRLMDDINASKVIAENATISTQRAAQLATQIEKAWGVFNDDEDAVYNAFNALNNEADLMLLISAYGIRKDEDLARAVLSRMSESERAKIAQILGAKKIDASVFFN